MPKVLGGPPSVQESLQTMNQSMGQMLTFIQNKKQLDEMKREFDLSSQALETRQRQTDTMEVVKSIAKRYKGGNLMAKDMGDDLTKLLVSGGFDPLLASNITNAFANTPADLEQQMYTTINAVIARPNDDPLKQEFIANFGGDTSAPDVRTGVYGIATKARGIVDTSLDALIEGDQAAEELSIEEQQPLDEGTTPVVETKDVAPFGYRQCC